VRHARSPGEQSITFVEERANGLVRFDPGRSDARIPEYAVGQRPITRRRIFLERQAAALVRKAVEAPLLDRGPDLPLDQRLADAIARRLGRIGPFRIAMRHGPRLAQRASRQAS
jgi:hypothetical protein